MRLRSHDLTPLNSTPRKHGGHQFVVMVCWGGKENRTVSNFVMIDPLDVGFSELATVIMLGWCAKAQKHNHDRSKCIVVMLSDTFGRMFVGVRKSPILRGYARLAKDHADFIQGIISPQELKYNVSPSIFRFSFYAACGWS